VNDEERPSYFTPEQWRQHLEEQATHSRLGGQEPPSSRRNNGGRPEIEIRAGEMQRVVDEAEAALIAAQASWPVAMKVFRRGDRIVALAIDKGPDHKGRMVESQIIVELGEHALAERLGIAATFQKWDGRSKRPKQVDPPKDVVKTLVERGYRLKLPVLVGVVNCPQLAANARILDEPGYDAATGMFYDPRGAIFPAVAKSPTLADAMTAKDRLLRLYHTFDFQSEKDRAVAMSLVLTRLARIGMATAPLHAYDAPTAGSGKSMLVDIASVIATGERATVFAQGGKLEEFEKRLSVQLMMGRQIIAIDNITQELDGDLLNQSITQEKVDLRILGQSRAVTTRCSTVNTATGNNLKLVGDLTRRALIARLDPKTDRPELRQFNYHPLIDARENRGELVAAALTIMKAYHVAGRPNRPPQLQSFEEWSDTVRGAMMCIGLEDPVKTQDTLRENDPQLAKLIRTATAWRGAFHYSATVAEAVSKAEEKVMTGAWEDRKSEPADPDLRDAFIAIARRGAGINPDALGGYLRSVVGKVVTLETGAKVRFEKEGTRQGAVLWALVTVAGNAKAVEEEDREEIPFN
jgi:putative DNA primase/helicase